MVCGGFRCVLIFVAALAFALTTASRAETPETLDPGEYTSAWPKPNKVMRAVPNGASLPSADAPKKFSRWQPLALNGDKFDYVGFVVLRNGQRLPSGDEEDVWKDVFKKVSRGQLPENVYIAQDETIGYEGAQLSGLFAPDGEDSQFESRQLGYLQNQWYQYAVAVLKQPLFTNLGSYRGRPVYFGVFVDGQKVADAATEQSYLSSVQRYFLGSVHLDFQRNQAGHLTFNNRTVNIRFFYQAGSKAIEWPEPDQSILRTRFTRIVASAYENRLPEILRRLATVDGEIAKHVALIDSNSTGPKAERTKALKKAVAELNSAADTWRNGAYGNRRSAALSTVEKYVSKANQEIENLRYGETISDTVACSKFKLVLEAAQVVGLYRVEGDRSIPLAKLRPVESYWCKDDSILIRGSWADGYAPPANLPLTEGASNVAPGNLPNIPKNTLLLYTGNQLVLARTPVPGETPTTMLTANPENTPGVIDLALTESPIVVLEIALTGKQARQKHLFSNQFKNYRFIVGKDGQISILHVANGIETELAVTRNFSPNRVHLSGDKLGLLSGDLQPGRDVPENQKWAENKNNKNALFIFEGNRPLEPVYPSDNEIFLDLIAGGTGPGRPGFRVLTQNSSAFLEVEGDGKTLHRRVTLSGCSGFELESKDGRLLISTSHGRPNGSLPDDAKVLCRGDMMWVITRGFAPSNELAHSLASGPFSVRAEEVKFQSDTDRYLLTFKANTWTGAQRFTGDFQPEQITSANEGSGAAQITFKGSYNFEATVGSQGSWIEPQWKPSTKQTQSGVLLFSSQGKALVLNQGKIGVIFDKVSWLTGKEDKLVVIADSYRRIPAVVNAKIAQIAETSNSAEAEQIEGAGLAFFVQDFKTVTQVAQPLVSGGADRFASASWIGTGNGLKAILNFAKDKNFSDQFSGDGADCEGVPYRTNSTPNWSVE